MQHSLTRNYYSGLYDGNMMNMSIHHTNIYPEIAKHVDRTGRGLAATLALAAREHHLLTVQDTAVVMSRTPWWVRQLIASGELRAINVGGPGRAARWRIDPEDLNAWMTSRESRPRDLVAAG